MNKLVSIVSSSEMSTNKSSEQVKEPKENKKKLFKKNANSNAERFADKKCNDPSQFEGCLGVNNN